MAHEGRGQRQKGGMNNPTGEQRRTVGEREESEWESERLAVKRQQRQKGGAGRGGRLNKRDGRGVSAHGGDWLGAEGERGAEAGGQPADESASDTAAAVARERGRRATRSEWRGMNARGEGENELGSEVR